MTNPDLEAQREYVRKIEQSGFDFGLTIGNAFIRGIRDIGYKHTGTALDELIDNAIQADAQNVHVIFGYGANSDAKPERIIVIDDGHGMDPDMIRLAVLWGGTHREAPTAEGRKGFGRYGYGLPSASVSQGRRFTVHSSTGSGAWNNVVMDLDAIVDGQYNDPASGKITVPPAVRDDLPALVAQYHKKNRERFANDLQQGTVVVLETLDRLDWKTTTALENHLMPHFAVTYRNHLRRVNLWVNAKKVEPVDPLFTTPGFRFYDIDEDRAVAYDPATVVVKDRPTGKELGIVNIRYSYLPPTFAQATKGQNSGKMNQRFAVMKEHNGVIFCREGRQIDVVSRNPYRVFQNNDRYVKVEVDFPASLDEEFHITTSKQQVVPSERMWELLSDAGVFKTLGQMNARYERDSKDLKQRAEETGPKRESETVMEEGQKFDRGRPETDTAGRAVKGDERLKEEAQKRSRETGRPVEETEREIAAELDGQSYKVFFESSPGAPFYRVEQLGGTLALYVNQGHPFFTDVYLGPESTPRLRAALELTLLVLGDCELDAAGDLQLFYQRERAAWSEKLSNRLQLLRRRNDIQDMTPSFEAGAPSGEMAGMTG